MTRSIRRRSGLTFLTLLAVQTVTAPMEACAQEQDGHENGPHQMLTGHTAPAEFAHGMNVGSEHSEESHHAPDSQPVDCTALAACGAPAIGTSHMPAELAVGDLSAPTLQAITDEPAAIVLGLTTPPPKI